MSRTTYTNRNTYVVGSNAVALDNYVHETMASQRETKLRQSNQNKKAGVYSINPACTFLLASVIIAMIVICIVMLKAQFSVADTSDQIIVLKNELSDLKRSNAQLTAQINEAMDLNDIRETAMNEYGMVYPEGADIVEINPVATSYTIQYASIEAPKEEKMTIGNMMAFITRGW